MFGNIYKTRNLNFKSYCNFFWKNLNSLEFERLIGRDTASEYYTGSASNFSEEGREKNRRVEMSFVFE
jgi:hypothetical protein